MAPRNKAKRKVLISLSVILLVILAGFLTSPPLIEKKMNRVAMTPAMAVSPDAQKLHQTLLVVDMHADSLLFDRDLLKRNSYGHVDIPRLKEGNVALQFFTVVTKSPKSQNIERNDSTSDNITVLAVAQRWPVSSWGSLRERALYQSRKLLETAQRSRGDLVLIKTSGDLETFIKKAGPEL